MAELTITIPDIDLARILQRFCAAGGWVDVETSGTRGAFAKQMVINYVKAVVNNVEQGEAEAAADAAIVIPETVIT